MKAIIYFLMCVLQPICLPLPEFTTYLFGLKSLGSIKAFIIGLIGVTIGLALMYLIALKTARYIIKRYHFEKKIVKLYEYVRKYRVFILSVLFIIPILPDEIICIGSPVIGINFLMFMIIGVISKAISIGSIVFSEEISSVLNINQATVIIIELGICVIATIIFNYIDGKKKK